MASILPPNPAETPYRVVLDQLFPLEERGTNLAHRTHELILQNDEEGLRQHLRDPATETALKVNGMATRMMLHPLHVCAMTGNLSCARALVETQVCQINPQDAAGDTPIHHAAVRDHQEMILFLLKQKAASVADFRGGTFAHLSRLVKMPDPQKQTFLFKDETGRVVEKNGNDFHNITGAHFLDKDCHITPEEWVQIWQEPLEKPGLRSLYLEEAYEQYCKNPARIYMEQSEVGSSICAGEDIQPGMVIGEYLGDIHKNASVISPTEFEEQTPEEAFAKTEYVYDNVDATHFRGLVAVCNDSFPNARTYDIYNKRGLPVRHILVATQQIRRGDPIVWNYGLHHPIRRERHIELRRQELLNYFKRECVNGFAQFYNHAFSLQENAIRQNRLPEALESMPLQALIYVLSTPQSLMLLACEGIIDPEELKPALTEPRFLKVLEKAFQVKGNSYGWNHLTHFYQTFVQFFDSIKNLPPKKKNQKLNKIKNELDKVDLEGLIKLIGGDPLRIIPLESNIFTLLRHLRTREEKKDQ